MRHGITRQCPSALFTSPPPAKAALIVQPFRELQGKALWEVAQTKGSQTTPSRPSATEFGAMRHRNTAASMVSWDKPGFSACLAPCLPLEVRSCFHVMSVVCGCKPPILHFPFTPLWKGLCHVLGVPRLNHDTRMHDQGSAGSTGCHGATEEVSGWSSPEVVW